MKFFYNNTLLRGRGNELSRRLILEMTCRGPAAQFYIPGVRSSHSNDILEP